MDPGIVIYAESDNKYSNIYCLGKVTYKTVSLTLKEVQARLPRRMFYRVHNSYLVSRVHMIEMNKAKTRIFCIEGITIEVGRAYMPDFLNRLHMKK